MHVGCLCTTKLAFLAPKVVELSVGALTAEFNFLVLETFLLLLKKKLNTRSRRRLNFGKNISSNCLNLTHTQTHTYTQFGVKFKHPRQFDPAHPLPGRCSSHPKAERRSRNGRPALLKSTSAPSGYRGPPSRGPMAPGPRGEGRGGRGGKDAKN